MSEIKTEAEFRRWFESAKPGEEFVYHVGFQLGVWRGMRDVSSGAMAARVLYDGGLVDLVQRRSSGLEFQYVAVKRAKQVSIPLLATFMSLGLTNRELVAIR